MMITNASSMIPHNLIHKYKHALISKGFKKLVSRKQHTNGQKKMKFFFKKEKNT